MNKQKRLELNNIRKYPQNQVSDYASLYRLLNDVNRLYIKRMLKKYKLQRMIHHPIQKKNSQDNNLTDIQNNELII